MAATVEELTVSYEEDGKLFVKELDKFVLTKGAWSTIMYMYQDLNKATDEWGPKKFRVVRYRKQNGNYSAQSKFNISSETQAEKIVEQLSEWLKA
jgi:hypothetical protein